MNLGITSRLIALGLGLGLMAALIVVVILSSQRQARDIRSRLAQVDQESFRIADHFKDSLREVNDKMRAYRTGRDPTLWAEFLKASKDLDMWIDEQKPRLKTQREKDLLEQIDAAYDAYVRMAGDLYSRMQTSTDPAATRAESAAFFEQSRHLADIGQALSRAHYDSRNQVLAHANHNLTQLRLSVLWLLGLLCVFAVALAFTVYRDMIAPLRVKLVESQALAERHEKLASLVMLAAGVAHEIRNPLTAIKAALFIQQKNCQAGSIQRADADLIEREILRLERIVNDFLQFARPADPELATIPADLPLREVQGLLEGQLANSAIQLVREESPAARITVDSGQIKQVLINLVQNAADSIGRQGTITMRARTGRRRLLNGEIDVAILEVSDTGKGISPEVEKRLFDPFFTTKESGTGLGLSIAAQIVAKHGGALQYQTQMNHGTTFGIVLPQAGA